MSVGTDSEVIQYEDTFNNPVEAQSDLAEFNLQFSVDEDGCLYVDISGLED